MNLKSNVGWIIRIGGLFLIVLLVACSSTAETPQDDSDVVPGPLPSELTDSVWHLANFLEGSEGKVPVLEGTEITAVFGKDNTITGSSGCNTYTALLQTKDNLIAIGSVSATEMACAEPEGIMEQESAYITALALTLTMDIEDGLLIIGDGSRPILEYAAVEEVAQASLPTAETPALAQEVLANMTYMSEWTQSGEAPLVDGVYSEPVAPGSATETVVRLTEHMALFNLEDGQPAAAVILVTDPGGSGTFYDLAAVVSETGTPVNFASTTLGDRVEINSLSLNENGVIAVDMVTQGPDDPMCCPTQRVINTYVVRRGELVAGTQTVVGADD